MSQPTLSNHPQTPTAGRHSRPPGTPLQEAPFPPGIQDGFQQQLVAVPAVYGQTYPATAHQGYPGATVGQIRTTGLAVFLFIVTLGIYGLVWYYQVHDEMKRHTNQGLGGGLALLIAFFVGIVMPFVTAAEVGNMYEQRGEKRPVSVTTGLWVFPGVFLIVGPIIWFVKTNGALNNYWRSLGAR